MVTGVANRNASRSVYTCTHVQEILYINSITFLSVAGVASKGGLNLRILLNLSELTVGLQLASNWIFTMSMLHFVAPAFLQAIMTAMMLLILLSGDVERNPGPYSMGKFQWLEL